MWFWSGKTVKETEISDITAYNHANGLCGSYTLLFIGWRHLPGFGIL